MSSADRRQHTRPQDGKEGRVGAESVKEDRSLGSLIGELTTETRSLVQKEVELARTEISEKIDVVQRNMIYLAIAGAILLAALLTLVAALNTGVTTLFSQFMAFEVAVWLAPLVLAVILGLIGYSIFLKVKDTLKEESFSLDETAGSLREDKRWIKEKVR